MVYYLLAAYKLELVAYHFDVKAEVSERLCGGLEAQSKKTKILRECH